MYVRQREPPDSGGQAGFSVFWLLAGPPALGVSVWGLTSQELTIGPTEQGSLGEAQTEQELTCVPPQKGEKDWNPGSRMTTSRTSVSTTHSLGS